MNPYFCSTRKQKQLITHSRLSLSSKHCSPKGQPELLFNYTNYMHFPICETLFGSPVLNKLRDSLNPLSECRPTPPAPAPSLEASSASQRWGGGREPPRVCLPGTWKEAEAARLLPIKVLLFAVPLPRLAPQTGRNLLCWAQPGIPPPRSPELSRLPGAIQVPTPGRPGPCAAGALDLMQPDSRCLGQWWATPVCSNAE